MEIWRSEKYVYRTVKAISKQLDVSKRKFTALVYKNWKENKVF